MDLPLTISLFVGQTVILLLCIWQDRKPVDPLKPKLLPYRLLMLILVVTSLATLAHTMAILTGKPVVPNRKMGM